MNALDILRAVKAQGVELVIVDGRIRATPPGLLDDALKSAIRDRKADLVRVIGRRAPPTNLDALRRLCPLRWRDVKTADGRRGLLWALSPYGAVVSFGPGEPLYTLDPCEVEPVHAPSAQGEI